MTKYRRETIQLKKKENPKIKEGNNEAEKETLIYNCRFRLFFVCVQFDNNLH